MEKDTSVKSIHILGVLEINYNLMSNCNEMSAKVIQELQNMCQSAHRGDKQSFKTCSRIPHGFKRLKACAAYKSIEQLYK